MKTAWALLRAVFRGVSYLSLIVLVVAFSTISYLHSNGLCPRIDTGAVLCAQPDVQEAANLALSVALVTMVTGIPVLLAVAGLIYLLRDFWRLLQRLRRT